MAKTARSRLIPRLSGAEPRLIMKDLTISKSERFPTTRRRRRTNNCRPLGLRHEIFNWSATLGSWLFHARPLGLGVEWRFSRGQRRKLTTCVTFSTARLTFCLPPVAYCLLLTFCLLPPGFSLAQDEAGASQPQPSSAPSPSPSPSPTPVTGLHQWGAVTLFHGLPSDRVRAIAQGPDGPMWFGTEAGLAKFDGRRTQTMTESGLPAGRILALQSDQDGALWI